MDQTSQSKPKRTSLYALIALVCLIIFGGIVFWQYQKPEKKSSATEQNQVSDNNQNTDTNGQQNISTTENLYRKGAQELTDKNYDEAIKFFDQAIAENPYEPQYYSDKSEAEYNLGQKDQAITTLKQGSSINPDSDLLKSKIDVLSKDQFSNPNIDTPRE